MTDDSPAEAHARYLEAVEVDPEWQARQERIKRLRAKQPRYARPARVPWWPFVAVAMIAVGLHLFGVPW